MIKYNVRGDFLNTLISIWTKPMKTLQYVLENKTVSYGFFILFLTSLSTGLVTFAGRGLFDGFPLLTIVIISIIVTYFLQSLVGSSTQQSILGSERC